MKKFSFSLERILKFKQTLYEKERNALAQLRAQKAGLEHKRDDTILQLSRLDDRFHEKAAQGGVNMVDITAHSYHQENGLHLIKQIEQEMAEMDLLIEKQLVVVVQLDKDVKGLEKLKEKQLEEYTAEAMKQEQERISEMVSSKFIEQQKNSQ